MFRLFRAWLPLGLGLAFLVTTTWLSWSKHESFNNRSLDLAMYTQVVWNIANGYPYETTLLASNRLHLAEHLALVLLPLAPLYALFPDVRLLLLLQQALLASSGFAVWWLARRRLGAGLALLVTTAFYASPLLGAIALDDFYPITFTALPLAWATALAISGRSGSAALLALGSALWEEEAALLAIGVGLYLLLQSRSNHRLGLAVLFVGGSWLGAVERLVLPGFHDPLTASDVSRAEAHFGELRRDPLGWLAVVAASRLDPDLLGAVGWQGPPRVAQACTYPLPGDCSALRWWIYPTAGLALLSPSTLVMAAPPAAGLLLPDKPGRFRRHWAAPVLPLLWQAAAVGLARLASRPLPCLAGSVALALATLALTRLDLYDRFDQAELAPSRTGSDLTRLGASIPPDASVVASLRGLSHLSDRRLLFALPVATYSPRLWPPPDLPAYALIDLEQDTDQVARLENLSARAGTPYRELRRTRVALLLERSTR